MKLGLDQKTLATQVGVSRQWIVDVETKKRSGPPPVDIDSIIASAREKRK
jgi:transcriptional regulator with XRE-family HTH domain